ncbi:MAG TPA: TIGR02281 family clan AA aspartic protease [Devosia sp.]|nr:TIGR02281 family clan AA aspartic protease [Devosia sp.]
MAFIGVALLVAAGLALLIDADAGSLFGMDKEQTAQLIPLLAIGLLIASGMFGRRVRFSSMLGGALLWAGMFAIVIGAYSYRFEIAGLSSRLFSELVPGAAVVSDQENSVTIRKGFSSTFSMDVRVNDARIRMIFDTGASVVVLTQHDARAAGIRVDRLRFNIPVQTANGTGRAAAIVLKQIEVGGIIRKDIRALVAEEGALETSLLGMTYLQTLSAYTVSRDSLKLQG